MTLQDALAGFVAFAAACWIAIWLWLMWAAVQADKDAGDIERWKEGRVLARRLGSQTQPCAWF